MPSGFLQMIEAKVHQNFCYADALYYLRFNLYKSLQPVSSVDFHRITCHGLLQAGTFKITAGILKGVQSCGRNWLN